MFILFSSVLYKPIGHLAFVLLAYSKPQKNRKPKSYISIGFTERILFTINI